MTASTLTNSRTHWDIFREQVNKINLRISLKIPAELEKVVDTFTSALTAAATIATSAQLPIQRDIASYPERIIQLVKDRRKARHQWQRTRNPAHKAAYNKFSKEVTKFIREHSEETFKQFVTSLNITKDTDYTLWKVAKATL